jgi:hypothetical protein
MQGNNSIAIGTSAAINTQGNSSIAIGNTSGQNEQGDFTIAIGTGSGQNTQGAFSISIGYQAGYNNQFNNAIAIGTQAGYYSHGIGAISIGEMAGYTNQMMNSICIGTFGLTNESPAEQGESSVYMGSGASLSYITSLPDNSICINTGTINNTIPIGNSSSLYINPIRNSTAGAQLYYNNSTYEISYLGSNEYLKQNIEPMNEDTGVLYNLNPKKYIYKSCPADGYQIGYIAEEVAKHHENFVSYDAPRQSGGNPIAIDYNTIVVFLVEEVKKLKNKIKKLKNKINPLFSG